MKIKTENVLYGKVCKCTNFVSLLHFVTRSEEFTYTPVGSEEVYIKIGDGKYVGARDYFANKSKSKIYRSVPTQDGDLYIDELKYFYSQDEMNKKVKLSTLISEIATRENEITETI